MSQNPFSHPYEIPEAVVPERTSVMAVLSLVFGVLCVPFFGLIAIILGVFALFGIKASRGRVSGTGLAVTGIILGILFSLAWGGCVGMGGFVVQMATKQIAPAVGTMVTAAEQGDVDALGAALTPAAQARLTPEHVEDFRTALGSEMGEYRRGPEGIVEYFSKIGEVFRALGNANAKPSGNQFNNAMPVPMEFEHGWAVVFAAIPQNGGTPGGGSPLPIENLVVLTPSGAEIVLIPYGTTLPSPAPTPAPGDPGALPPGDRDAPAEPAGDAPADESEGG